MANQTISGQPDRNPGVLFNFDANEASGWFRVGDYQHPLAATLRLRFAGTWNSGTITLATASDSDGNDSMDESSTLTDDGYLDLTGLSPDTYFQATMSGATSPDVDMVAG